MQKILLPILCCLASISLYSQSADRTEGCVPLEISFTGLNGLSDYFWTFGTGASSDDRNPSHIYSTPGQYTAILTEGPGGVERGRIDIIVYNDPVINLAINQPSVCAPSDVTINPEITLDPGLSVTQYAWTINGRPDSVAIPTETFTLAGDYTVGLSLQTNVAGCDAVASFPDIITVIGTSAQYTTITTDPCVVPMTATFTNTTIEDPDLTYSWSFGDGSTSSSRNVAPVTYTESGVYEVSLIVSSSSSGCADTLTQLLQAGVTDQLTMIPDTFCIGVATQLINNTNASSHVWFATEALPSFSRMQEPILTFTSEGIKTIRYTATLGAGCIADSTYTIYVQDPMTGFTADPAITCADPLFSTISATDRSFATYIWNGTTTTDPDYVVEYTIDRDSMYLHQFDTIGVTFTGITTAGCVISDSTFVLQRRPNAELTSDVTRGCAPLTVNFTDISTSWEPIATYTWLFGNGDSVVDGAAAEAYTYTTPGVYQARLIIENDGGCIDTSNRHTIYVGEEIPGMLDNYSFDICLGESIDIETPTLDPRIQSYLWRTDDGRQSDCWADNTASVTYDTEPGTYDIELITEYHGCYSSTVVSGAVRVGGANAHIGYQTNCDSIYTVSFVDRGKGATSREWDFAGLGTSTELEPSFTFPDTGDYEVILIARDDTGSCSPDTARQMIHIRDLKAVLDLPSIGCDNESLVLSAVPSQHVHNDCFRGYIWQMPTTRPREVPTDTITHLFPDPGPNIVRVTVRDINGCMQTAEDTIEIYSIEPAFTIDPARICLPAEIDIVNNTTSDTTITSWSWSFGETDRDPGTVIIDQQNYAGFVSLEVEDAAGCTDFVSIPLPRYIPGSVITASKREACIGDTIFMTATDYTENGSFLRFDWDFGPFGSSTQRNPFFIVDEVGIFNMNVEYTEASTGCSSTNLFNIIVIDRPEASFTVPFPEGEPICFANLIAFTNTSTTSNATYEWDFGGLETSTIEDPSFIFPRGTYDVTLEVIEAIGCSDITTSTYTFFGPDGSFITDKDSICFGEEITFTLVDAVDVESYRWDFGDGTTVDGTSPITHTFDTPLAGNTTAASIVLSSADGACEAVVSRPLSIIQTIADFLPVDSSIFCPDDVVPFTNLSTGSTVYDWDFGNDRFSNLSNPSNTYSEEDTFAITLIASEFELGCTDTITKTLIIGSPEVGLQAPPACAGDSSRLLIDNYDPDLSYEIVPDDGRIVITSEGIIELGILETTTSYTVSVIDNTGCLATQTINAPVLPDLEDQEINLAVWEGDLLDLPVDPTIVSLQDVFSVVVDPAQKLNCNDCLDLAFVEGVTWSDSIVTVSLSDDFGCIDAELTYRIHATGCDYFPNTYSPNGDRLNDNFDLISRAGARSVITLEQFTVIDRWGQPVYQNNNVNGWNGRTPDGDLYPADVYNWYAVVRLTDGDTRTCKGNVTIIR